MLNAALSRVVFTDRRRAMRVFVVFFMRFLNVALYYSGGNALTCTLFPPPRHFYFLLSIILEKQTKVTFSILRIRACIFMPQLQSLIAVFSREKP